MGLVLVVTPLVTVWERGNLELPVKEATDLLVGVAVAAGKQLITM
jgi:hypothetical protein